MRCPPTRATACRERELSRLNAVFCKKLGGKLASLTTTQRCSLSSVERRMAQAMDHVRGAPTPGYARSSRGRWHFLYFVPLPHQQGAFRPSFGLRVVRGRWGPAPHVPPGSCAPQARQARRGPTAAAACWRRGVPRRKACGERGGRRVGTLPMRTVSRQGAAHQDEVANSGIFKICHTAPGDERPQRAGTFCGKVYHAFQSGLEG